MTIFANAVRVLGRLVSRRDRNLKDPYLAEVFGARVTTSRARVSPAAAEGMATVLACVQAIASALASLDVYVYRLTSSGRVELPDHPLARMARGMAGRHQLWPDFIEWTVASTLLHGNGLAEIEADELGELQGFTPIPWGAVSVVELPTRRLAYDVSMTTGQGALIRPRRLLQDQVLHLRDRSDDGLIGRSRLARAAESIGTGLALQSAIGALYANGVRSPGIISIGKGASREIVDRLQASLEETHVGVLNSGKPAFMPEGTTWIPMSMNPEDAEILATRRFTTEELARIYQVPPPLVGIWDHASFTNSETAGRWFSQFTLAPWARKLSLALAEAVFGEDDRGSHEIVFDMSSFLRGDPETRWRSHEIAVKNGILDANEVREAEGYNPRQAPPAPSPES